MTTNASRFMNLILQPHMKQARSYCKNATHVVNILKTTRIPPTSFLASLDIESLYTNISFDMAIEVLLKIFSKHPRLVLYLDLLKFVLKNNIFQFSGKIYHQMWYCHGHKQRWHPLLRRLSSPTMRSTSVDSNKNLCFGDDTLTM